VSATRVKAEDAELSALNAVEPGVGMPPGQDAARPRRLGLALVVIAAAQLMVVLDATIVNVALPHIQDALHFSGSNLEWVVNAYTLAFGGLLLLGGRSGDLLGRRRIFVAGIALFALASLAGGFATDQGWLLTARVIQGIGGALAAPASLSLIAVTFPEGKERNRAMGVYAGVSISGAAIGLIAGGLLTSYADWRWVFFVNVPIGLVLVLLAPRVIRESERVRGKFDLPGAITGSLGLGALVYGLSEAATTFTNGQAIGHWGSTKVIVSLVAAVVLLGAFAFIEARSRHALVPPRVLASRDRTAAYLISLCIGTAIFGMFFFMTLFVQEVWGYSPVRSGIAYLPMVALIVVGAGLSSQLVARIGARPLITVGPLLAAGGMFWLSRITEHSTYAGGLLGPMMLTGLGMGLTFVPLSLVALAKVPNKDTGVASSLLNTGQQVGGSIGDPWHRGLVRGGIEHEVGHGRRPRGAPVSGGADSAVQPCARLRVRAWVPGVGGDLDPRGDHRGGDDPDQEVGPGGHRPDGGPDGLSVLSTEGVSCGPPAVTSRSRRAGPLRGTPSMTGGSWS
jgi:EmrB/QacA subfamily drug resistance transporter